MILFLQVMMNQKVNFFHFQKRKENENKSQDLS